MRRLCRSSGVSFSRAARGCPAPMNIRRTSVYSGTTPHPMPRDCSLIFSPSATSVTAMPHRPLFSSATISALGTLRMKTSIFGCSSLNGTMILPVRWKESSGWAHTCAAPCTPAFLPRTSIPRASSSILRASSQVRRPRGVRLMP